jgi:hypothetical protein
MPPTSPTPSLTTPGPPLALPSSEAGPSGPGTPLDLRSLCSNRLLRRFTHLAAPSGKGRALGSWDSTAVTPQNFKFWNVTKIHYFLKPFINRIKFAFEF